MTVVNAYLFFTETMHNQKSHVEKDPLKQPATKQCDSGLYNPMKEKC